MPRARPERNLTLPSLTPAQEAEIFAAVQKTGSRMSGLNRARLGAGLTQPRFRQRFLMNAYAEYLAQGGKAGNGGEFVKWLLNWLVENQTTIIAFIKAIMALFIK